MKLMVRMSVLSLVFAGAFASAFTPKTTKTHMTPSMNNMVVSSAAPVPICEPGDPCGF